MRKITNIFSAFLSLALILTSVPAIILGGNISVNAKNVHENVSTYTEDDMTLRFAIPNKKASNGAYCHIIQGMHMGTTYIYTAKTDDNGNNCVFIRVNVKTGEQTFMKCFDSIDASSSLDYSTLVGYADEMVVRSVAENGVSNNYMYVTTGKAPYSLTRHKVYGENMYFTGCFDTVDSLGNSMVCNSIKWLKTSDGYHYFLLKAKSRFYVAKIATSAAGGTVENPEKVTCYLLFETDHKNALFANSDNTSATASGIESWTHNGFEYDSANNFLYTAFYNKNNSKQSAVVTFSLDGIVTDENLFAERDFDVTVFPTKLSFMFNEKSGSYFEVETCGFRTGQGTAGDLSLYFNVNSDDGKEGIYSLSYTRHTEAFESVIGEDDVVYSVEYNGNGSTSGSMKNTTHVEGIKSSLRKNSFAREGYTFLGWYFYRNSDQKWIYENNNGVLTWRKEENRLAGEQKYLGLDTVNVYNLTYKAGDTITCFAVWTKNAVSKTLEGYSPVDLGTKFFGKIRFNGYYLTANNNILTAENATSDTSQSFRFVRQGDGSYIIYDYGEANVFNISGGTFVPCRNVKLTATSSADNQKFYIYYINGKFYLKALKNDILIGVDPHSKNVQLSDTSLSNENAFEIYKYSFDSYAYLANEYDRNYGNSSVAFVRNPANGKLMTADGDNLVFKDALWDDSQKWNVIKSEDGSYSFVSVKTGKAVTVMGSSDEYGGNIDLDTYVGGMAQNFYLHTSAEGHTLIKPVYTTYVFDMDAKNFDVHIYPFGNGSVQKKAQRFEILSSVSNGAEPLYMGKAFDAFIHTPADKVVTDNGTKVYGDSLTRGENQVFAFEYDSAFGAYKITGLSGKVISVENNEDKEGAKLVLSDDSGLPSQRFYIYKVDSFYYLKSVFSNKIVDLASGDNTTLQIYGKGFTERRQLVIEKKEPDVLVLVENSSYSSDGQYLLGVCEKTTSSDVISSFENSGVSVFDLNGNAISDGAFVGTSFKVCLVKNGEVCDSLTVIVRGDMDSNGVVDSTDYMRIKQYFLGTFQTTADYQLAADVDGNEKIDATDYLRVKSHFLGTYNIYE